MQVWTRALVVLTLLCVPGTAMAQSLPGLWFKRDPPPREVSFTASTWSLLNFEPATSGAVTYTRNVAERYAFEATVDVASAKGGPFGMLALQVRTAARGGGPGFATVGYKYAVASSTNRNAPRDGGMSVGGGLLIPLSPAAECAVRAEAQVMLFRRHHGAIRLTAGVTLALD